MSTKPAKKSPVLVSLTPEEKRHLPRPIADFAEQIEPMLDFYAANKEALHIDGLDIAEMRAAFDAYQALQAPIKKAEKKLALLRESALHYGTTAWSGFLELYARGKVGARLNHDVARGMVKFIQAMKKPHKKKRGPAT